MKPTIGEKIALLRKARNISRTELAEYLFLLCLMNLYRRKHQQDKLMQLQNRLLELLPGMSYNEYFEEAARKEIEQACQ